MESWVLLPSYLRLYVGGQYNQALITKCPQHARAFDSSLGEKTAIFKHLMSLCLGGFEKCLRYMKECHEIQSQQHSKWLIMVTLGLFHYSSYRWIHIKTKPPKKVFSFLKNNFPSKHLIIWNKWPWRPRANHQPPGPCVWWHKYPWSHLLICLISIVNALFFLKSWLWI